MKSTNVQSYQLKVVSEMRVYGTVARYVHILKDIGLYFTKIRSLILQIKNRSLEINAKSGVQVLSIQ